jgi:hypothetical protein
MNVQKVLLGGDGKGRADQLGATRLMNRCPTRAKVLITIYATAIIAIALVTAFLL